MTSEEYIRSLEGLDLRQDEIHELLNIVGGLKAKNEELRARIEKAVELPCRVGDKIYLPWECDDADGIMCLTVTGISIFPNDVWIHAQIEFPDGDFQHKYRYGVYRSTDFGQMVFTAYEAAKARLKVLRGGKKC